MSKVNTQKVVIDTTPQVVDALKDLVRTGLFGETMEQCAEELLRDALRQLQDAGWVKP